MIEIKSLHPSDHAEVLDFWRQMPGLGLNPADDGPEGFVRFLRRNPNTCFAALTEGRIVGTVLAGNDGRRGYLYHVAVHPDHQGHGIGRQLVERAMDALTGEGIRKTALVVFADNEQGNAFWESMGFIERRDLNYRNKMNGE